MSDVLELTPDEKSVEEMTDEEIAEMGKPLGQTWGFTYICPECSKEGKKSSTSIVSAPVTLVTRMPICGPDGKIISLGVKRLLVAMVCENGHEHITSKSFEFKYDTEGNANG